MRRISYGRIDRQDETGVDLGQPFENLRLAEHLAALDRTAQDRQCELPVLRSAIAASEMLGKAQVLERLPEIYTRFILAVDSPVAAAPQRRRSPTA